MFSFETDWALRVLGKTNGTMIEAMITNGTASPLTADRITEVHDAQREQKRENCVGDECTVEVAVEPFPHEDEVMAGGSAGAAGGGESAAGEEAPAAAAGNSTAA